MTAGRPGAVTRAGALPDTSAPGAEYDVAVVGAGVVGCALARELARHSLRVALVEASGDVGDGTSKANTAILHTGFDAVPGSLEARLVRDGRRRLLAYADAAASPSSRSARSSSPGTPSSARPSPASPTRPPATATARPA